MKAKHHLFIAAALCACIALAACNDDARDPAAGLDPTTQPLIFSATVAAPTTAVATPTTRANTAASQWTDGDEVAVEMNGVVKKYIIKTDAGAGATASLRPADAENTHFWPDLDQPVIVRAWRYGENYPYYDSASGDYREKYSWDRKPDSWEVAESQNVTRDGESNYQRSDFLYAPAQSVSYDAVSGMGAGLTFYHQTARVEVRIRKAGLVTDDNKGSMLVCLGWTPDDSFEMPMNGTFNASQINPGNGELSGLTANETTEKRPISPKPMSGTTPEGYARCYEALVIPQNMDGKYLICIRVGNELCYYKPKPGEANLQGGYTYTYDIIVSKYGTLHVTVGTPIAQWGQEEGGSGTAVLETTLIDLDNPQTISDDGAYLMTGTNLNGNILNITGGKPLVILRDLNFSGHIHITGGTPEIRVEGKNNQMVESGSKEQPMIWLDGADANVRITGEGIDKSKIQMSGYYLAPVAGIGSPWTGSKEASACGNIEISNLELMLDVVSTRLMLGGPCIGASGGRGSRKCGNITITNAALFLSSRDEAVTIGFGCPDRNDDVTGITYEMGDITITNSTIESTIFWGEQPPAHIGGGEVTAETYRVGAIRINTGKNATDFFAKFTTTFDGTTPGTDEVVVGFPVGAKPKNGEEFDIYWNGEQVGPVITGGMVPGLP